MSEMVHTILGMSVCLIGVALIIFSLWRFWRRSVAFNYAAYLVRQAHLDVDHGAENMRIARAFLAAERAAQ